MVKIVEFTQPIDDSLPFNPAEDLMVFMKNDPVIYRKSLFPALSKMSDCYRNKEEFSFAETMRPVVVDAAKQYCKKYNMPKPAGVMFPPSDIDNIIERLKEEELEEVCKGTY